MPTILDIIGKIQELKKHSSNRAERAVPPDYVKDDDRGRPFDRAYNERERYRYGYEAALSDVMYALEV